MKLPATLALLFTSPLAFAAVNLSVDNLVGAVIWLIVAGLIFWLCTWMLAQFPIPAPFNTIIRVLVALIAFVIVLNVLLGLAGSPLFSIR